MPKYFTFNIKYFLLFVILFITEVLIAVYAHDRIIRPYVGDLLVVILMYCFFKALLIIPVKAAAIGVLIFAYIIEVLQNFHLADMLGFHHSQLARIILGTSFEWIDLIAYTIGFAIILIVEIKIRKKL